MGRPSVLRAPASSSLERPALGRWAFPAEELVHLSVRRLGTANDTLINLILPEPTLMALLYQLIEGGPIRIPIALCPSSLCLCTTRATCRLPAAGAPLPSNTLTSARILHNRTGLHSRI